MAVHRLNLTIQICLNDYKNNQHGSAFVESVDLLFILEIRNLLDSYIIKDLKSQLPYISEDFVK